MSKLILDDIKEFLIQLISKGIVIIPNTSKTDKEILPEISHLCTREPARTYPLKDPKEMEIVRLHFIIYYSVRLGLIRPI